MKKISLLKKDLEILKESFLNTGKVRAQVLTIDGISTTAKTILRASKKDSVIYNAINTAIWFNLQDVTNGKELLTTVHALVNTLNEYADGTTKEADLLIFAEALQSKRLVSEIKKAESSLLKLTEQVTQLKAKVIDVPIYVELLESLVKRQENATNKVIALKERGLL